MRRFLAGLLLAAVAAAGTVPPVSSDACEDVNLYADLVFGNYEPTVGEAFEADYTWGNSGSCTSGPFDVNIGIPPGVNVGFGSPSEEFSRGTCSRSGSTITCHDNGLPGGDSGTATLQGTHTKQGKAFGKIAIKQTPPDTDPEDDKFSDYFTARLPQADLTISKTVSDDAVVTGSTVSYTILVANRGPDAAQGVMLTDKLPRGFTVTNVVTSKSSCTTADRAVKCALFTIEPDDPAVTVTITGTVDKEGKLTNTAEAKADTKDPITPNKQSADLWSSLAGSDVRVFAPNIGKRELGDAFTLPFLVDNHGPAPATGVVVIVDVSKTFTIAPGSIPLGCTLVKGTLTCNIGSLGVDEERDLEVDVTASATGKATFTVTGKSTSQDPNKYNNKAVGAGFISGPGEADLSTTIYEDDAAIHQTGDTVLFGAAVSNHGPATAVDVKAVVTLPKGFEISNVGDTDGAFCTASETKPIVTCLFPTVAGAPRVWNVEGTFTEPADTDVKLEATSPTPDKDKSDNKATVAVVAIP